MSIPKRKTHYHLRKSYSQQYQWFMRIGQFYCTIWYNYLTPDCVKWRFYTINAVSFVWHTDCDILMA